MGNHRMFAKKIVMADSFIDLPMSTRCLYFSIGLLADDEGFIDNPKSVVRQIAASTDDLKLLVEKKYVFLFDSGVLCIRHWKVNNHIRADRFTPTIFTDERAMLELLDDGTYEMKEEEEVATTCQPLVVKPLPQVNKYKYKHKDNVDREVEKPSLEEIEEYIKQNNLSVEGKKFFQYYDANDWKDAYGNAVTNWKQKLISWDSHGGTGNGSKSKAMGANAPYKQTMLSEDELDALLVDLDAAELEVV